MNTPNTRDGWVSMPLNEFERLIEDAAERGARRAMTDFGLDGESAAAEIRELRGLLEAFNTARHTAWQTLVRMVTTGFILALVAGALIKLKLFGGGALIMLTLLGSPLGFLGSAFPEFLKLFRDSQDRKHELAILDRQMGQRRLGHSQRLEEVQIAADVAESQALYSYANHPKG